jgi:hypothetical protein
LKSLLILILHIYRSSNAPGDEVPSSSDENIDPIPDIINVVTGAVETTWKRENDDSRINMPQLYTGNTRFSWPMNLIGLEKAPFDYFLLFWDKAVLETMVRHTSDNLQTENKAPLSKGELLKYFGIRLYMSINPIRGSLDRYWAKNTEIDSPLWIAHNVGERLKMSLSRFNLITKCLSMVDEADFDTEVSTDGIFIPAYACTHIFYFYSA